MAPLTGEHRTRIREPGGWSARLSCQYFGAEKLPLLTMHELNTKSLARSQNPPPAAAIELQTKRPLWLWPAGLRIIRQRLGIERHLVSRNYEARIGHAEWLPY